MPKILGINQNGDVLYDMLDGTPPRVIPASAAQQLGLASEAASLRGDPTAVQDFGGVAPDVTQGGVPSPITVQDAPQPSYAPPPAPPIELDFAQPAPSTPELVTPPELVPPVQLQPGTSIRVKTETRGPGGPATGKYGPVGTPPEDAAVEQEIADLNTSADIRARDAAFQEREIGLTAAQETQAAADRAEKLARDHDAALQALEASRKETLDQSLAEIEQSVMNLERAAKFDPRRVYHDMNIGQKIAFALSAGIAGLQQVRHGGGNWVLEYVNKLAQQDLEAQRAEYEAQRDVVGEKRNQYGILKERFKDDQVVMDLLYAQKVDAAKKQYEAALSRLDPARITAQHQKDLAALDQQSAAAKDAALRRHQENRQAENTLAIQRGVAVESERHNRAIESLSRQELELKRNAPPTSSGDNPSFANLAILGGTLETVETDPATGKNGVRKVDTVVLQKGKEPEVRAAIASAENEVHWLQFALDLDNNDGWKFWGSENRQLRQQVFDNLKAIKTAEGGRAFSDKDMEAISKGIDVGQLDRVTLADGTTVRKKLELTMRMKKRMVGNTVAANLDPRVHGTGISADNFKWDPPREFIPQPPKYVKNDTNYMRQANKLFAELQDPKLSPQRQLENLMALGQIQKQNKNVLVGYTPVITQLGAKMVGSNNKSVPVEAMINGVIDRVEREAGDIDTGGWITVAKRQLLDKGPPPSEASKVTSEDISRALPIGFGY